MSTTTKKKKSLPLVASPLSEVQKKQKLEELQKEFDAIAEKTFKLVGTKNKCFIILQDQSGQGISKATDNFSTLEFAQWVSTIVQLRKVNL